MNKYKIYFEFLGEKMSVEVVAKTEIEAKVKLKDDIIFHKIDLIDYLPKEIIDHLLDQLKS